MRGRHDAAIRKNGPLIIGPLLGVIVGIVEILLKGALLIPVISAHLTAVYRIDAVRAQILKENQGI